MPGYSHKYIAGAHAKVSLVLVNTVGTHISSSSHDFIFEGLGHGAKGNRNLCESSASRVHSTTRATSSHTGQRKRAAIAGRQKEMGDSFKRYD